MSYNPTSAIARFLYGIFQSHRNLGMPKEGAKAKMYDETYDEIFKMIKNDTIIPDHSLVISAQHMRRLLNERGYVLSQLLKEAVSSNDELQMNTIRQAMKEIQVTMQSLDEFISVYKGVS